MAVQSKGNCYLCGAELGKVAMKNHILKVHAGDRSLQKCRLLKIEGAYEKNYWLYIDVPVNKTLSAVDIFLRKIWLECCGHMSAFSGSRHEELGKGRQLGGFAPGDKILHEYDFGSTTESLITVVGDTYREPQRNAVRLLARNAPPAFICCKCGKAAAYICVECIYEVDNPFFCEECADHHEHDYFLPVTNSPRMGVCGYEGTQDKYAFSPLPFGGERP